MPASMHDRQTDAEPRHTAHVTRLALELFDALRAAAGLPASARRVLEAACVRHDAAFAMSPARHPAAAASLVLHRGAPGLSPVELRMAAVAVRLHGGGWRAELPRLPAYGLSPLQLRTALRVTAFLRVADALDHSHLQDASIRSIHATPSGITVSVRCAIYPGNAAYANRKADLWNRFCPVPIAFCEAAGPRGHALFSRVVTSRDAAAEAARRTLLLLYRLVADARLAVLGGEDAEGLHDLRVAIRRYRVALRFYRNVLDAPESSRLSRALSALQKRLSPFRDAEVYLRFLAQQRLDERALRPHRSSGAARRQRLTALLESAPTRALLLRMAAHARARPPAPGGRRFTQLGARRLLRIYDKVLASGDLPPGMGAADMHARRKLARRARYYAEMCAPAMGGPIPRLAHCLKAVADTLGDARDAGILAARVAKSFPGDSRLRDTLAGRQERGRAGHAAAWRRLARPAFRRQVIASLRKAGAHA